MAKRMGNPVARGSSTFRAAEVGASWRYVYICLETGSIVGDLEGHERFGGVCGWGKGRDYKKRADWASLYDAPER